MKAISITPGKGNAILKTFDEPEIQNPGEVKIKILEVGICGTDREEVLGGRADAPENTRDLIIGHEMFGRVVDTGPGVTKVSAGDYAVLSVRRGCGKCVPCLNNRSDMCYTGEYKERGIKKLHGYQAEFVVDQEQYIVKVPDHLRTVGVLAEPLSVAEKAIDEALSIQRSRLPEIDKDWIKGKKALVAGIGAIGLLAAMILRLRGAEVFGLDIVDVSSKRPKILRNIGGEYIDTRKLQTEFIDNRFGEMDFIFESTGVAELGFNLIDALAINGIYVMTGIPRGERPVCFSGASMMTQIVLKNQLILGSVNAGPKHFEMAIKDLDLITNTWSSLPDELITTRVGHDSFHQALDFRSEDDIKTVVMWE